jgi:hypothetical protein
MTETMAIPKSEFATRAECRRCHKRVRMRSAIPFTHYRAGDVATWICVWCINQLVQLRADIERGIRERAPARRSYARRRRERDSLA